MLPDNGVHAREYHNLHMTLEEWKIIMKHIQKNCSLKWFAYFMLLSFRGLRPKEAMAINILDFSPDFHWLTFRECKTNKMRTREYIIPELAKILKTYVEMNRYNLTDGYLFPFYKKNKTGATFMSAQLMASWFAKNVRNKLKKTYPNFEEHYLLDTSKGHLRKQYRIGVYSFRRFFETYIYVHNEYAPMSEQLIKEIMEYSSKFSPLKHYIKLVHHEEQKAMILENTLNPLASMITHGQKTLENY